MQAEEMREIMSSALDMYFKPPAEGWLNELCFSYPQQHQFIQSAVRHFAFLGGVGSGKTYAGAYRALRAAYGVLGEAKIPCPNHGMVTAPTFPMLRDNCYETFQEIAEPWIKSHNRGQMRTIMRNGSKILWRTVSNPDRLRGVNLSWLWMDEAALYDGNAFDVLIARLREGGNEGYSWITTTTKGKNWLYKKFIRQQSDNKDYGILRAYTEHNPFLPAGYVENLKFLLNLILGVI